MTKAELMALLAEKKDDEDVGVLKTEELNPVPPAPQSNPQPNPQPKPNEIKADTVISGTAAELMQLFAPMFKQENPKPEEEKKSAEVYI